MGGMKMSPCNATRCLASLLTRPAMTDRARRLGRWVVVLWAGLLPSPVLAQPQHALEDITVTARKQEQRAFDVPLSLSVLQGEGLDRLRASGLDVRFLTNRTPSLQVMSGFGRIYPYFFIRGLGNTDFDMNASQPVSIMHDGIVLENPWLKGHPIFDVERVEVLRGPQGTLFGRNTPAGIVKVESARPTWEWEGYGRLSYGRFDSVNFEGALSGPLIPSVLAARASLLVQRRSDWIDNTYTGKDNALGGYDDIAGRVQFMWTPVENFSGRFKVHVRDFDSNARVFRANIFRPGRTGLRSGLRRDKTAQDAGNPQYLASHGFATELHYTLGGFRLISLTGGDWLDGRSRGDVDGGFGAVWSPPSGPGLIPFPTETADGLSALRQLSQEFRLEHTAWQRLDWRVGFFYFHEELDIEGFSYDTLAGSVLNGRIHQEQRTEAWAVFAAATFTLTENIEVAAGVRVSEDDKEYASERLQSPIGAGPLGPVRKAPRDLVPSWDLSLRYQPRPGVQPYVRVASSFRAPSIQGRLLFGDEVTVADTEDIISVEVGLKLRVWQQRVHLDLAAYHFWMHDQQLTAGSGVDNANRLLNADRTIGRGIEAEGAVALGPGLHLTAGLSYNYTRLDDTDLFVQPCGSDCTVLDPPGPVPGTVSIDGNRLPQAPRWIANLNLSYTRVLPSGAALILATDWAYRSRINFFLYESREFRDNHLLEGGLRLSWLSASGRLEVAAFGRNILNNISPTGGLDFNNLAGFVNEPPVWGIEAAVRL